MAIYRPSKPRWRAVLAGVLAGLVVGLGVGAFAFGRQEPQPVEGLRELRSSLSEAAGILEVAQVEYEESVTGGRVVSETEYEGARSALQRSRTRYEQVRAAVTFIEGATSRDIDALYQRAQTLMDDRAEAQRVGTALRELASRLEGIVDG